MSEAERKSVDREIDAVVVGAGFAGLYMLNRLRKLGLTARAFEVGTGVGGTWFWNRYPGARCDVESLEYSYQFDEELQQKWEWTERYAGQPEILRYLNHAADRFDLRRDIQLETRITSAIFDAAAARWTVETDRGDRMSARFCIMATGCLSSRNTPRFAGLEAFRGDWFHTGDWPEDGMDRIRGKRAGIIGTGSSGIQAIPHLATEAKHLHIFQRTPNYSVPAGNHPLDPEVQAAVKAEYRDFRERNSQMPLGVNFRSSGDSAISVPEEEREAEYEDRWQKGGLPFLGAYADLLFDPESNETAAEFVRRKIRGIVKDPAVAEILTPKSVIGCKRLCSDTGYFETFNRPNVTLVDVAAAPIAEITATGLRTKDRSYELDVIVFATGFDAMTGALAAIDLRGKGGLTLSEKWAAGPRTYLGLTTAGFPNLFIITGPGSPSVLSNMVPSVEQHANWVGDAIDHMRAKGIVTIEPTREAEDAWVDHVNEVAGFTLYPRCNSWYLGANVPGKPRVFMPYLGFPRYVQKCEEVVANGYEGFDLA